MKDKCQFYDVIIVGAGSAGICAAVSASRILHGDAKVALVEKSDRLGGTSAHAFVHTFCGLYEPNTDQPPLLANQGLPAEIEELVLKKTGQKAPTKLGKVYVLSQHPETFHEIAQELINQEAGTLDLLTQTSCEAANHEKDGTFSLRIHDSSGEHELNSKSIIDCTANANISKLLGIQRQQIQSNQLQRPAYIFEIEGVGQEIKEESFPLKLSLGIVRAVKNGILPSEAMGASIRPSVNNGCFISIDLDSEQVEWDPSSEDAVREVHTKGQKLGEKLYTFLINTYAPLFRESSPKYPETIGIRESYTSIGQYTLTEEDLIEGREFEDVAAKAAWPIELRETTKGPIFTYFEMNESSQIPLSCLMSQFIPGLYFAGRCISASHKALASVRVMGTCFATGQAAGIAASLYAKDKVYHRK